MANLEQFLSRLQKVRKNGSGFVACCPAHQDKSPSLTIKQETDGKILIHCFAGCGADEVVGAIGMELSDLMPEKPTHHHKRGTSAFNPYDVLAAVRDDMTLALLLAKDMQAGRVLNEAESLTLAKLAGRMSMAIRLAGGRA